MLRLCLKSFSTNKTPILHSLLKGNPTHLKCVSTNTTVIQRYFASKLKENEDLKRIYYGPLTPQIRAVKLFSLTSSILGLAAQPIIIREAATIGSTSLLVALCSVVGFFTFVTPLLLHFITKKYVIEMDYEPTTGTYSATTINFFLTRTEHKFKPDNVDVPDIPGMFTTMKANNKPLFIEARHFTDPMHYARIMGYDKPMDFKLGTTESENK